ncbi:hypothetical protein Ahy_A07g030979 isoform A [Arachis hypogaea]|uniref:Uncharacterized protein n=1 Tax=Arachis hypogaea TaxID=3818 RepID=A0A445C2H3_ARAHY|nr:hypothetical protein Ahy_A07g030979 isoform A [Arachis hypogaea]
MRDTGGGHTASTEAICNAFQIDSVTSIGVVKEALDSSGGHVRDYMLYIGALWTAYLVIKCIFSRMLPQLPYNLFLFKGRGTVATGRVEQGIIKFGDEVEALGLMHGPMVDSILQTFDAFHLQCCYANVS